MAQTEPFDTCTAVLCTQKFQHVVKMPLTYR